MSYTAPERYRDPLAPRAAAEPSGRLPLITPASVEFYSALMVGLGERDRERIRTLLVVDADDPADGNGARP